MKTLIIGSSRGIGLELAKLLSQRHEIIAVSRNIEPLEHLSLTKYAMDISEVTTVESEILKIVTEPIDNLIINAAVLIKKSFTELTAQDWGHTYNTNVVAPALIVKVLLKENLLRKQVLAISSIGGIQGSVKFPGLSSYSSSKGALITLMECLAEEYKDAGTVFNSLALGSVQTEMLEEAFPGFKASKSAKEMAEYIQKFVTNDYKYFNGKCIPVANTTP